jgi:hypothetical protein
LAIKETAKREFLNKFSNSLEDEEALLPMQ